MTRGIWERAQGLWRWKIIAQKVEFEQQGIRSYARCCFSFALACVCVYYYDRGRSSARESCEDMSMQHRENEETA